MAQRLGWVETPTISAPHPMTAIGHPSFAPLLAAVSLIDVLFIDLFRDRRSKH